MSDIRKTAEAIFESAAFQDGNGDAFDMIGAMEQAISAERQLWTDLLTPTGRTKALYHGEFSFPQTVVDEDGDEHTHKVFVPWTTVKEIMDFIRRYGEAKLRRSTALDELGALDGEEIG